MGTFEHFGGLYRFNRRWIGATHAMSMGRSTSQGQALLTVVFMLLMVMHIMTHRFDFLVPWVLGAGVVGLVARKVWPWTTRR